MSSGMPPRVRSSATTENDAAVKKLQKTVTTLSKKVSKYELENKEMAKKVDVMEKQIEQLTAPNTAYAI